MRKVCCFLCIVGFILYGCNNKEEIISKYHEFTYADSAVAVISTDTVHAILVQLDAYQNFGPVSYTSIDDPSLGDTIKFRFTVKFGGYSETPAYYKSIHVNNDTIIILYTHAEVVGIYKQSRNHTINSIETSLKPVYTSVRSVEILKSPSKILTFSSRTISTIK